MKSSASASSRASAPRGRSRSGRAPRQPATPAAVPAPRRAPPTARRARRVVPGDCECRPARHTKNARRRAGRMPCRPRTSGSPLLGGLQLALGPSTQARTRASAGRPARAPDDAASAPSSQGRTRPARVPRLRCQGSPCFWPQPEAQLWVTHALRARRAPLSAARAPGARQDTQIANKASCERVGERRADRPAARAISIASAASARQRAGSPA